MPEKEYSLQLSGEDEILIVMNTNRGKLMHFVVQYYALINGRWRTIMRFDTCHGYPHKHTYYLSGQSYTTRLQGDIKPLFTESKKAVIKNLTNIKENFLRG